MRFLIVGDDCDVLVKLHFIVDIHLLYPFNSVFIIRPSLLRECPFPPCIEWEIFIRAKPAFEGIGTNVNNEWREDSPMAEMQWNFSAGGLGR